MANWRDYNQLKKLDGTINSVSGVTSGSGDAAVTVRFEANELAVGDVIDLNFQVSTTYAAGAANIRAWFGDLLNGDRILTFPFTATGSFERTISIAITDATTATVFPFGNPMDGSVKAAAATTVTVDLTAAIDLILGMSSDNAGNSCDYEFHRVMHYRAS